MGNYRSASKQLQNNSANGALSIKMSRGIAWGTLGKYFQQNDKNKLLLYRSIFSLDSIERLESSHGLTELNEFKVISIN